MKKCPFCGSEIEDSARFCLYCMQSLTEKEQIQLHKKKKPQWLRIIAATVVVLVIFILLFWTHQPTSSTTSSTAQITTAKPTVPATTAIQPTTAQPTTIVPTQPTIPATTQAAIPTTMHPTTQPHKHRFFVENTASEYLCSEASCLSPASYYYSCACGEKGMNTFYLGKETGHTVAIAPGHPADCVNNGLTDRIYCTVCNTTIVDHGWLSPSGHTYALTDPSGNCMNCGERGPISFNTPSFPHKVNDTYEVYGGTYSLQLMYEDTWLLEVYLNYINISSQSAVMAPTITLQGVGQVTGSSMWLNPGESTGSTCTIYIHDPTGTYDLVFE